MSRDEALRRAGQLREALLDYGVRKVSIEIQQGRPGTPNGAWYDTRFIGTMGHHIVSLRSQGLTPGLSLVKKGRAVVLGPLCNGYGGFDEIARIICLGWANHPGAGGPYTLPGGTVPKDAARPYLFGWEFEGGVREADWTDSMRNFMGRCHAGTLDWLGRGSGSHIEHKTWAPTRKIDRLHYTLADARAEIRRQPRLASGGTSGGGTTIPDPTVPGTGFDPEDDVFTDADKTWIATQMMATQKTFFGGRSEIEYDGVNRTRDDNTELTTGFVGKTLNAITHQVLPALAQIQAAQLDPAAFADALAVAIVSKLPTGTTNGTEITAAVEQGIREVLGSLDDAPA